MIGRIRGTLLEKKTQAVLVDVNGLGYEVQVPMTTVFQLPALGQLLTLHTHLVVREDAQQLYGFLEERDRALFRILIRVSGVGPRLALAILSSIEAEDFAACVRNNDLNALTRLPGIGKKTAERLLMEVRDKLKEWDAGPELLSLAGGKPPHEGDGQALQEAESALISLGYKPAEASRAIKQAVAQLEGLGETCDSEALLRCALRGMAK